MTGAHNATFLGIFDSPIGKLEGRTHLDIVADVSVGAASDAGYGLGEIDGLLCVKPLIGAQARHASAVAEYLGLSERLSVCRTIDEGGASPLIAVITAFQLVSAGVCRAVLVVAADTARTGQPTELTLQQFATMRHPIWEQPSGMTTLSAYALVANAYLNRYGLADTALASIPVEMRQLAETNPTARFRKPLHLSDVLGSPMVSTPLRQMECTTLSDGGSAIIIGERSLSPDRASGRFRGFGEGTRYDSLAFASDIIHNGSSLSVPRAFDTSGISIDDIDIAFLYDSYSIALALQLESIGACERGQATQYIADAGLGITSPLPVNPHGGLLSHGHCGSAAGMQHLTEMVRQMRGEAVNQVQNVDSLLVHGEGGVISTNCTGIFSVD